jgi:hypothetical protein
MGYKCIYVKYRFNLCIDDLSICNSSAYLDEPGVRMRVAYDARVYMCARVMCACMCVRVRVANSVPIVSVFMYACTMPEKVKLLSICFDISVRVTPDNLTTGFPERLNDLYVYTGMAYLLQYAGRVPTIPVYVSEGANGGG